MFCVASVIRVLLPVLDIYVGDATNEQFQLSLVKDIDKIWGNQLVEARDKSIELLFNTLLDPPFGDESELDALVINIFD